MKEWLRKNEEILRYLFFGILTTLVNYIVYFAATRLFQINYLLANAMAWIISVLFAFVTNRKWVFASQAQSSSEVGLEFLKFVGGRVFSLLVDMAIMFVGIDLLNLGAYDFWVKTLSQVFVVILNYIISKFFVFKD